MNKLILTLTLILSLGLCTFEVSAQSNKQSTPSSQQQIPFNIQDLLGGMNLDEMFGEALKELESTRSIWEQYVDPALVDSALNKMTDPQTGESFDALFQHIEKYLDQEEGIGSMFDQLLQQFNMPMNGLPFGNPLNPQELEEGEWQIIPNVPNPPKQQQQKGPQKKGVSVI